MREAALPSAGYASPDNHFLLDGRTIVRVYPEAGRGFKDAACPSGRSSLESRSSGAVQKRPLRATSQLETIDIVCFLHEGGVPECSAGSPVRHPCGVAAYSCRRRRTRFMETGSGSGLRHLGARARAGAQVGPRGRSKSSGFVRRRPSLQLWCITRSQLHTWSNRSLQFTLPHRFRGGGHGRPVPVPDRAEPVHHL